MQKEDERIALMMYNEGKSDKEIANVIGKSSAYICSWRHNKGLICNTRKGRVAINESEAFRLYDQGFTEREMAEALNVTRGTVVNWKKRHDLRSNRPPFLSENLPEGRCMELYRIGLGDSLIAEKINAMGKEYARCNRAHIERWRKRNNLPTNKKSGRPRVDREPIMQAYKSGLNDRQIADECGICTRLVRLWRKELGLSSNYYKEAETCPS